MLRYVSPLGLMSVVTVSAAGAIGAGRGPVGAEGRSSRSRQACSNSKPIADAASEVTRARELRDQGWVMGASREGGRAFPGPARRATSRLGMQGVAGRGCSTTSSAVAWVLFPSLPDPARPRPTIFARYAESHVSRYLRRQADRRAQRLRPRPGARGGDAAVRVRRRHAAPDDALRGGLCPVGDLFHALSRRSLSGSDRAAQDAGAAGTRGADQAVRAEGREETAGERDQAGSGKGAGRGRNEGSEAGRREPE